MTTTIPAGQNNKMRYIYQLIAGRTISDIGSYLDMIALNLYVYLLTGSAVYMGLFMAVRLLGSFLAGFYSGMLADKFNRKKLMIISDVARFCLLFSLFITPQEYHFYMLYFVIFGMGMFSSMFNVSMQSSIPMLVSPENRVRANALLQSWQAIAMVVGMLSSGILINLLSYQNIFLLDSLTYLLSAVNLISLPIKTNETRTQSDQKASFFSEFSFIYRYLRVIPVLLSLMTIRLFDTFGSAAHNVGIPIYSSMIKPDNPSIIMGFIWGIWAIGNLVGSRFMSKHSKNAKEVFTEKAFGISTILMSFFFILLFAFSTTYLLLICAFLAGVSDGISAICYNSRLQQVSDDKRGRVFGVSSTLQTIGFAFGMLICSPLFEIMLPIWVVGILHGVPMVMALIFTIYFYRKWKAPTELTS
ncbi:MFS transporter [Brevibacillus sp. 7WMA2]|uniref:MFS transporter n=1 Tax=Brevibacillus sp. 7WMA2 TaxID=2683193 RepID=UPI0013A76B6C|nr:MFS transporter [Brevibacillus sp. 7WMA2]QIC07863.1 MFS transporter [Brevibacillus sp. 7WMA2]